MNLPTLYHKGKNGEMRQWRCWAEGDTIHTEHGLVGGQLQISSKRCIAKNVGKKNETSVIEQALSEAKSLHANKLERKYSLTQEEAQSPLLLPMLAKTYDEKKHKAPYYCQPKLDGVRCLARWENGKVALYSRAGKLYSVKHISDELENILGKDDIFDGELYIHGMHLQSQISLIKKPQAESKQIKYWVYDMPVVNGDENLTFNERQQAIDRAFGNYYEPYLQGMTFEELKAWRPELDDRLVLVEVDTYWAETEEDMKFYLKQFIEDEFEGLMIRYAGSSYLWGYRSNELVKVKLWQDEEFIVLEVKDGRGKMEGHAIMVCQNNVADNTFDVVPEATMEERKYMFEHANEFIGRKYTVKFFDRSEDELKPRFATGLAFREDI